MIAIMGGSLNVKAATADDLRELIGEKRLTEETRAADIRQVLYQHQQTLMRNELIELLDMTVQEYLEFVFELKSCTLNKKKHIDEI